MYGSQFDDSTPFEPPEFTDGYGSMLQALVEESSLEALSLLAALFREAWGAVRLYHAIAIGNAVIACVLAVSKRYRIPSVQKMLMRRLILDRILGNVWITHDVWMSTTGRKPIAGLSWPKRIAELEEFVHWYIFHPKPNAPHGLGLTTFRPLCTDSPSTEATS